MQTHEWEALLDGTTPGRLDRGADPREIYAVDDDAQAVFVGSTYRHNPHSGADANLFASAPAAVAEVVRLRKVIEDHIRALRAPLCSRMPEGDEMDEYVEQWGWMSYEAEMLTRILEGDTDE